MRIGFCERDVLLVEVFLGAAVYAEMVEGFIHPIYPILCLELGVLLETVVLGAAVDT